MTTSLPPHSAPNPISGPLAPTPRSLPLGLSRLHEVPLDVARTAILAATCAGAGGPSACRRRMQAEARDLLALEQISAGRLTVLWIDLSLGLRAKVALLCPVPCLADPLAELRVAPRAILGLIYPPEAMVFPQPGYTFVRVLEPRPVWLGNCSPDHNQVLCLGSSIAPGTLLKELIVMTYGALSMQTVLLDRLDPAGVLNAAAAEWWQQNAKLIPLSREPFLPNEVLHVPKS